MTTPLDTLLAAAGAATAGSGRPWLVLIVSVALVVGLIAIARLHAFFALVIAAIVAGILAGPLPGEPARGHLVQAVELTTVEFGVTAGKIGIVIALAAVIGMCLAESGAAEAVVRRFLRIFGARFAGAALLLGGYVLSIPIFFDTFFMLLVPLARALAQKTGKDYLLYVLAICCGGTLTHALVAPHPGPLALAEILKVDLGLSIVFGLSLGLLPMAASWAYARWINRRLVVPIRPVAGMTDDAATRERADHELPTFLAAIAPVIVPIALIACASSFAAIDGFAQRHPALHRAAEFAGNRNVALFIGALLAVAVLLRQRRLAFSAIAAKLGAPLETAGVIILITAAGGAFGLMLKNAGVGDAVRAAAEGTSVDLIVLAYLVSAGIRIAQGSTTVALLTTGAMMQPMLAAGTLPYHPLYVFAAIGFGGMALSWMNDSGFWVVGRLSGLTERETLRSWTVVVTINSVVGLLACVLFSRLLPLR